MRLVDISRLQAMVQQGGRRRKGEDRAGLAAIQRLGGAGVIHTIDLGSSGESQAGARASRGRYRWQHQEADHYGLMQSLIRWTYSTSTICPVWDGDGR